MIDQSQPRPFPHPMAHPDTLPSATGMASPIPSPGSPVQFAFTTMEGLASHFSQWLPAQFVHNLIENEKEIFVVRRECSLQETRLQFLKKCENALTRSLAEFQSGRSSLDWGYGSNPAPR